MLAQRKSAIPVQAPWLLTCCQRPSAACTVRSAASQGDMLMPGNLLLEVTEDRAA